MKPQRRDPVATRNKLLTAARHEFALNGLAGARVDEIALRAGVNKQLVYHYFGDKDALYLAVLEWVYEEIRAQERKLNLTGLPPERAIKKLIESSFDHLARYPDFIVLLNDENRNGARHVRASRKLESMHSPLVSMVSTILKEGVQAGIFRKGINPVHLYISIAGLSYFFFSNTPTLSAIFGTDLSCAGAKRRSSPSIWASCSAFTTDFPPASLLANTNVVAACCWMFSMRCFHSWSSLGE